MKLRQKTLLIIVLTLVSMVVLLVGASQFIVIDSYRQLEDDDTGQNVQRAQNALQVNLDDLRKSTVDYGAWDETWQFAQGRYPEHPEINLHEDVFKTIQTDILIVLDVEGQVIYDAEFDTSTDELVPLSQEVIDNILAFPSFINYQETNQSTSGIVLFNNTPLLVASAPIITSLRTGPITGTFIWGRYLVRAQIAKLAEDLRLSLVIYPINDPLLPDDFKQAKSQLESANAIYIEPLSENRVAGYTVIDDLAGNPALVLRVDQDRDIYEQGQRTLFYFALALVGIGIVVGMTTYWSSA